MIRDNITKQIGEALKARDEVRLTQLRMLSSALNYEFIAKQHELSQEEEIVVVRREIKKRQDAIEAYEKAGAKDRADKERKEIEILKEYLPEELPAAEIEKFVSEAIIQTNAADIKDMGKVIALVKEKTKGAVDGKTLADLVKNKLLG